jgi:hypothetical protein
LTIGNKCKFSHDKNVERKVEKVNIYEDTRKDDKKTGKRNDFHGQVGFVDGQISWRLGTRRNYETSLLRMQRARVNEPRQM